MAIGWVKFFCPRRGYGFLYDVETLDEVFVHYSSVQTKEPQWRELYRGEYVSFVKLPGKGRGFAAVGVTGVQGGPLLCEEVSEPPRFYRA
jgi:cold shock CspA family protein